MSRTTNLHRAAVCCVLWCCEVQCSVVAVYDITWLVVESMISKPLVSTSEADPSIATDTQTYIQVQVHKPSISLCKATTTVKIQC
jgi:hypothetical protein